MRIIVVDDEARTRTSLINQIKKLFPEFEIVGEADNGLEGLKLIQSQQPNLVITDIKMPGVDGLKMIENARTISPGTQYLVLSGYAEFELAQKAVRLSVIDYLLKPITVNQLKNTLLKFKEDANKVNEKQEKPTDDKYGNYSDFVSYIVNDIDKSFSKKLYLEDYALKLNITPQYASNIFSLETGKPFSAYLRDVRIDNAKKLLETTDLKIYEIALQSGYSDVKYFCRVFKETLGTSPKNYARSKRMNS